MRKTSAGLASLALAAGTMTVVGTPSVSAAPAEGSATPSPADGMASVVKASTDDLPNPLEDKRRALRQEAITAVLNGEARAVQRGSSTVVKIGSAMSARAVDRQGEVKAFRERTDQYVELAREDTDRVFAILAEFGNRRHPDYPDKDLEPDIPGPTTFEGPRHNQIPRPNRNVDNSTIWQRDYDRQHYQDLYFGEGGVPGSGGQIESVKEYYERQSSGRYSINGYVTDWTKVRFNEARYGRSTDDPSNGDDPAVCASIVCSNTWVLVKHAANKWYRDQLAAGRTPAQIRRQLRSFDVWDRYDHDGDGDFNEADGYMDHFQVVHAGGDMANSDPYQGEDAIWSHRWYVQTTPIGAGGPPGAPFGGEEIGDTGIWVGDYTIQPENGGSVFHHEYAHDLGLPDLYDFADDNNVEWWSLMAQNRVSDESDQGIGTRAQDLGPYEKLQLGWLDYDTMLPQQNRKLWLGPHEYNSTRAQAAVVVLPKKRVTTELVEPFAGQMQWWSGAGDDLNNTMSREVDLPAGAPAQLRMQAQWDIEDCGPDPCDYAYVEVDDGSGWAAIPGSITRRNEGNGIDGTSDGWVNATFDLSTYAGQTIGLRLRYQTDGAVSGQDPAQPDGLFADNIMVTSGSDRLFRSGAENGDEGWTLDGFSAVGSSVTDEFDNYYLASHRDYVSFDAYLKSGPYNFGFPERPDFVEHFPYQDGLLIWYWDTSQSDNSTSDHPGEGLVLPIDAHPRPRVQLDGDLWRNRVSVYDAPFSLEKSDSFTLHDAEDGGRENYIRGYRAKPLFKDSRRFWFRSYPSAGVKVPDNGVNISVLETNGTSMKIRVWKR